MNNTYEKDLAILEAATAGPYTKALDEDWTAFYKHFNPVKVRELVEENRRLREAIVPLCSHIQLAKEYYQWREGADFDNVFEEVVIQSKKAKELLK